MEQYTIAAVERTSVMVNNNSNREERLFLVVDMMKISCFDCCCVVDCFFRLRVVHRPVGIKEEFRTRGFPAKKYFITDGIFARKLKRGKVREEQF